MAVAAVPDLAWKSGMEGIEIEDSRGGGGGVSPRGEENVAHSGRAHALMSELMFSQGWHEGALFQAQGESFGLFALMLSGAFINSTPCGEVLAATGPSYAATPPRNLLLG